MEEMKEDTSVLVALQGATMEVKCRVCSYVFIHLVTEESMQQLIFPTPPTHPCPECASTDWIFTASWEEGLVERTS